MAKLTRKSDYIFALKRVTFKNFWVKNSGNLESKKQANMAVILLRLNLKSLFLLTLKWGKISKSSLSGGRDLKINNYFIFAIF